MKLAVGSGILSTDGGNEGGRSGWKPADYDHQQQVLRMLHEFKTSPCASGNSIPSHDHRCCPFYHSERDRRRPVISCGATLCYCAEPCDEQFDDHRHCYRGDSCGLCHSTAELLYHPDFFRKRLCHQAKRCPRGRFCAFAHSRAELLVPHFTDAEERDPSEEFIAYKFKTQWCPIGGPHDWENCVYAHTYRDWRRMPILGYCSRPCPQWTQSVATGPPELTYEQRCPRGVACPMAHGAKEQLYHPQFYKTSPCSEGSCKRGPLCAFTHGESDCVRCWARDQAVPSRSLRDPIANATQFLDQNQPTYWNPPRYHALEDGGNTGKGGKAKQRGFSFSAVKKSATCAIEGQATPATTASNPDDEKEAATMGTAMDNEQQGATYPGLLRTTPMPPPFFYPPAMYYCTDSRNQFLSQPMGYPMHPASAMQQLGFAPIAWPICNAPMMCLPDHLQIPKAYDKSTDLSFLPDSALLAPGIKSKKANRRSAENGLQTPSSWGSPPLSGIPTEAPTPREADTLTTSSDRGDADGAGSDSTAATPQGPTGKLSEQNAALLKVLGVDPVGIAR
eukprot:gnl/TRDRNA2_/TRDRNA2_84208_c0_seq1.p1 gnl/TRDRNA2_/TRDRNA2_84208_c0~~gnl/TRDRNA2_/TRDRNA2_84208_c0_seq1.p1  ORF type:complete len:624 (+),score=89.55 gnl/TRDRNA2_/TRDRNA2_84208_c0_seq1:187-1872(+)